MTYLLDTCVLSDFARGDANTLERLKATSPELVAVSSITAMEIEFGLALDTLRARKIAPAMHALLGAVTILPYDIKDARATGVLRAVLQKKGRPIGAYDALIAGCALSRGLVLVTSNEREFGRVSGLAMENWRNS
ncbi:MAG: type II toxin-antitoxin system VapC family toxin [Burkholderiales bacterium]